MPWEGTEVVFRWLPQVPVPGSANLSHFCHTPRIPNNSERWIFIFDNPGAILIQIHWLGLLLVLTAVFQFKATLVIWTERLTKAQYQENNPAGNETQTCNP